MPRVVITRVSARGTRGVIICNVDAATRMCRAGSNTTSFTFDSDGEDEADEALLEQGELTSTGLDGAGAPVATAGMARPAAADGAARDVPVTYNYSFFHLVFALASTYIAMLMTGVGRGRGGARADGYWLGERDDEAAHTVGHRPAVRVDAHRAQRAAGAHVRVGAKVRVVQRVHFYVLG